MLRITLSIWLLLLAKTLSSTITCTPNGSVVNLQNCITNFNSAVQNTVIELGGFTYTMNVLADIMPDINNINYILTIQNGTIERNPLSLDKFRILNIQQNTKVNLYGLTIQYGDPGLDIGGGIYNAGIVNIDSCNIYQNKADPFGGGILNFVTASATITNSTISSNSSVIGTGLMNLGYIKYIRNSNINNNFGIGGGALTNGNTIDELSFVSFNNNTGNNSGTLLNFINTSLIKDVSNCSFSTNNSPTSGIILNNGTINNFYNNNISLNTGYGFYNNGIVQTFIDNIIYKNTNTGIFNDILGSFNLIQNCLISTNGAGGLFNGGIITKFDYNSVVYNFGSSSNHGIANNGMIGQISFSNISFNNSASGIGNAGTISLVSYSTIANNGNQINAAAGGINNAGNIIVDSSNISNNKGVSAGGLNNSTLGIMSIKDSTVYNNLATTPAVLTIIAGGILNSGNLTLLNNTVVSNYINLTANPLSPGCGGIFNNITGIISQLSSTIAAMNIDPSGTSPDFADVGTIISEDHNLIGSPLGNSFVNGVNFDKVGTIANPLNPLLGPLQNNGGFTMTMAVLPGSPAVASGFANGLPYDQRGFPYLRDGGDSLVDIGAYEHQTCLIINNELAFDCLFN